MRLTVLTNTTLLYSITHFIYANSVVKRPGTSVPRRYKKKQKHHGTTFFFKYRWYRGPGSWRVWPYDFRDAGNVDEISESSYKILQFNTKFHVIFQRLDELIKNMSLHLNQIMD